MLGYYCYFVSFTREKATSGRQAGQARADPSPSGGSLPQIILEDTGTFHYWKKGGHQLIFMSPVLNGTRWDRSSYCTPYGQSTFQLSRLIYHRCQNADVFWICSNWKLQVVSCGFTATTTWVIMRYRAQKPFSLLQFCETSTFWFVLCLGQFWKQGIIRLLTLDFQAKFF